MEVIDHVPTINVEDDTLASINSIDDIKFKNVVFQYKSRNNPAVRGVNINILKGKTSAFVGESGSGKTTIVKLLNRLYDPTEGEVLINGQDLRSINLRQYRRHISYVSQEPSLFNESIKENLLNGNPFASDAEIEEALKVCMAYDFIQQLPQGINTNFGEIGGILSGGQKQRIALARAVLRKPDLLILDEATSALDMKNEKNVQEAIENVSKQYRMTTVVIAHRLNTIINADMIYVLNKGEVAEKGNHNELINNGQMYAEYYKSQQFAMKVFQAAERNHKDDDDNTDRSEDHKSIISSELDIEEDVSAFQTSLNLLKFTNPKIYVFISLFCTMYVGCSFASISLPFSKQAFKVMDKESDHEKWKAVWYLLIILGSMAIGALVVQTCARYFLRRTTDILSINMRSETFKTLVKQPIQFFDSKSNSIGSFVGMLASDIRYLNGNSVEYYLIVFQGISALTCGII